MSIRNITDEESLRQEVKNNTIVLADAKLTYINGLWSGCKIDDIWSIIINEAGRHVLQHAADILIDYHRFKEIINKEHPNGEVLILAMRKHGVDSNELFLERLPTVSEDYYRVILAIEFSEKYNTYIETNELNIKLKQLL